MPIKKRFLECDCGEVFSEAKGGLEGKLTFSTWKHDSSRVRTAKTEAGGDIVAIEFIRYAKCDNCSGSLMIEKKTYDLSPAHLHGGKDHAAISVNREFVMSGSTDNSKKDTD